MTGSKNIELIRSGDPMAFKTFMEDNIDEVFRLVVRTVTDKNQANDIVQETFIKVWEKRKTLRINNSILNWTKRIALNKCYDYLRGIKRKQSYISINADEVYKLRGDDDAEYKIKQEEYEKAIKILTDKLSPKQRLVFTLSFVEKMSADEIAELSGLTKSTIKSNLNHARRKIKENLNLIIDYE